MASGPVPCQHHSQPIYNRSCDSKPIIGRAAGRGAKMVVPLFRSPRDSARHGRAACWESLESSPSASPSQCLGSPGSLDSLASLLRLFPGPLSWICRGAIQRYCCTSIAVPSLSGRARFFAWLRGEPGGLCQSGAARQLVQAPSKGCGIQRHGAFKAPCCHEP